MGDTKKDVLGPSKGRGAGFSADRRRAPPSPITGTTGCVPRGILGSGFSLVGAVGRIYWHFLDSDLRLTACPDVGVRVVDGD